MMTCEDAERILCNQCIHHVHCMIHDKECEPMNRLKQPLPEPYKKNDKAQTYHYKDKKKEENNNVQEEN